MDDIFKARSGRPARPKAPTRRDRRPLAGMAAFPGPPPNSASTQKSQIGSPAGYEDNCHRPAIPEVSYRRHLTSDVPLALNRASKSHTPCIARSAHRSRLPSRAQPFATTGSAPAYEPRMIRPAQQTGRHQASRFKLRTRRHQASVQDHGRGFRLRHRLATAASVRCPCHTHVSKGRGFLPAGSSASPGTRTVRYTASPVGADEISKLSDAE